MVSDLGSGRDCEVILDRALALGRHRQVRRQLEEADSIKVRLIKELSIGAYTTPSTPRRLSPRQSVRILSARELSVEGALMQSIFRLAARRQGGGK